MRILIEYLNWGFYWIVLWISLPIFLPLIVLILAGIMGMVWRESSSGIFAGILFLAFLIIFPVVYALAYGKIHIELILLFKILFFMGLLGSIGGAILEGIFNRMKSWRLSNIATRFQGVSLLFWGTFWTLILLLLIVTLRGYTFCDILFNQKLCCEIIYNRDSCLFGKDIFKSIFHTHFFLTEFLITSISALPGMIFYWNRKKRRKNVTR